MKTATHPERDAEKNGVLCWKKLWGNFRDYRAMLAEFLVRYSFIGYLVTPMVSLLSPIAQ